MRLIALAAGIVAFAAWLASGDSGTALFLWATERQRDFQNAMAGALQAIRAGDGWALTTLCALSAGYGFVHALGPGHGKLLLGGTAASGLVPVRRMVGIGLAASLAQSGAAILLVLVGVKLLQITSQQAITLTEGMLAAVSYFAIALIGVAVAIRGARMLLPVAHHPEGCGCGHHHGPTPAEVARANSVGAAVALITSIAIRPCSGALFLLVIAWRFNIVWQGMVAVIAMGLGTAAFNTLAILGGGGLRRLAGGFGGPMVAATAQMAAGGLIALLAGRMALQFI